MSPSQPLPHGLPHSEFSACSGGVPGEGSPSGILVLIDGKNRLQLQQPQKLNYFRRGRVQQHHAAVLRQLVMAIEQPPQCERIEVIRPTQIEQNGLSAPPNSQQGSKRIIAPTLETPAGQRPIGGDAHTAILIYGNRSQDHFQASPQGRYRP